MTGYPRRYGRYVLDERIAMGGMAEIFRARTATEGFEKRVCIKRILPHFLADEEFVTMFRDEARTAAKLQHGNVVQVFDFGEEEETLYLAMEFVEGADLRRLLDAGRKRNVLATVGEVVQIGIDVSRGLQHAHTLSEGGKSLGIVHRDISPHNIMLSHAGEVKVTDFGIAKAAERSTQTSTGIVKGKVAYMSPEQAEGRPFDHRLDQFAVGVVLWEALCGVRLFAAENDIATLRRVLSCDVPAPSSMRRDVPPAVDEVIKRTLSREPADRYADMRALEQALSRVLYGGAVDPNTADVRNFVARVLEPQAMALRRTQIADAGHVQAQLRAADAAPVAAPPAVPLVVAAGSLPMGARTQTSSDPARLLSSTDNEAALAPISVASEVSMVFSSSEEMAAAPRGTLGPADGSNPLARAIKDSGANLPSPSAITVAHDDPQLASVEGALPSASEVAAHYAAALAMPLHHDATPATRTNAPRALLSSDVNSARSIVVDTPMSAAVVAARPRGRVALAAAATVAAALGVGVLMMRDRQTTATTLPASVDAGVVVAAAAPAVIAPAIVEPAVAAAVVPVAAPVGVVVATAPVPATTSPTAPSLPDAPKGAHDGDKRAAVKREVGSVRIEFDGAAGWANVTERGKVVTNGDQYTSDSVLPLSAGHHRLHLVNPDAKLSKDLEVDVIASKLQVYSAKSGKRLK